MVSLLGATNVDQYYTSLSKVTYSTKDSLLGISTPTHEGSFFEVSNIVNRKTVDQAEEGMLMKANFYLYPSRKIYSRKQYTVIDALGQLGGLMSVLVAACRALMFPISRHMYYWNAIKRLFLARTSDDTLFLKEKKGKQKSGTEK